MTLLYEVKIIQYFVEKIDVKDRFSMRGFCVKFYENLTKATGINVIKALSSLNNVDTGERSYFLNNQNSGIYNSFEFMLKRFRGNVNSSLSEHIFRRSVFERVGFKHYPLAWATDDMLILEMSDFKDYLFIADAEVEVKVFEGSTSGSSKNVEKKAMATSFFFRDLNQRVIKSDLNILQNKGFLRSLWPNVFPVTGLVLAKEIYFEHRGVFKLLFYKHWFWQILKKSCRSMFNSLFK